MKVYFDIITNHTADVIGYEEGARTAYVPKDVEPYRTASGTPFDDRDYAGTDSFPPLDPETSFPYTPVLEPGEQNLKVPSWLNDVTLYHNRGNTTFVGEDSYYGDFFGLDDLFTEHPHGGRRDDRHLPDLDRRVGYRRLPDRHHEARQRRVLAAVRTRGARLRQEPGQDASSSCSARSSTPAGRSPRSSPPATGCRRCWTSRSRTPPATSPRRASRPASCRTFFRDDDWYTDADSNVYQLPTFLGNHDMGRIGYFLKADNAGAAESELLARDRLAHELMYFSRGNPVVYYGDEQGFTGDPAGIRSPGSRCSPARSLTTSTTICSAPTAPMPRTTSTRPPAVPQISGWPRSTEQHPALRDGAHQHRYATDGAGIYAFSRILRTQQREYVVALNNSEPAQTAAIPDLRRNGDFSRIYGSGPGS